MNCWKKALLKSERYDNINYIDEAREGISILLQNNVIVVVPRNETCSIIALEEVIILISFIIADNISAKYMIIRHSEYIY